MDEASQGSAALVSKLRHPPVLFHVALILLALATYLEPGFLLERSKNPREQAQPNSTFQILVHIMSPVIPLARASNRLSLNTRARKEISLFPPLAMAVVILLLHTTVGNDLTSIIHSITGCIYLHPSLLFTCFFFFSTLSLKKYLFI